MALKELIIELWALAFTSTTIALSRWDLEIDSICVLLSISSLVGLVNEFSTVLSEFLLGWSLTSHPWVSEELSHGRSGCWVLSDHGSDKVHKLLRDSWDSLSVGIPEVL